MPTISRSRTIPAPPQDVWEIVADPHHLPRWWPRVARVEDVGAERWTQVLMTRRGKPVRADFELLESQPPAAGIGRRMWEQRLAGTPFGRVLEESITEVVLEPDAGGTRVTIAQRQQLRGYSRTGRFQLRRAAGSLLAEALDGLARIHGG
jgi:uncharacterized protein YndB with AHSA1/START domain